MITKEQIVGLFNLHNVSFRGDEIICSCPFPVHEHGDRNPSFGINVSKGVYNCFSCHESGNLVQLCERLLGMNRMEAMSEIYSDMTLAEAFELMESGSGWSRTALSPLECDITDWCSNRHEYWHQRGFTDETIGKWRLGYDPSENRVVVPVYFNGELVGWTKRRVNESDSPKWKHSRDFYKNAVLFGIDNTVGDSCILVEAPLSAIMLDQYGIGNAVASFGCNLSDEQAILLRSNYNNVCLFYDPDEAGRVGAAKAIKLLERFVNLYIVPYSRDDPAAMTKEECEAALANVVPSWAMEL